jgi:uncharacterized protein YwgA
MNAPGPSGLENEPIRGRTRLQKELFLIQKRLMKGSLSVSFPFRPFKYGPFCKEVYDDVQYLKREGLLAEEKCYVPGKGVYVDFKLTEKGQSEATRLASTEEGEKLLKVAATVKKEFNQMGVADLVVFTHKEYPGYVLEGYESTHDVEQTT